MTAAYRTAFMPRTFTMAKKKAAKKRAPSRAKKGRAGGGKKKTSRATNRRGAKKHAAVPARHAVRPPPPGHHREMRIGLSRNGNNPPPFHVDPHGSNTFVIFGDGIGARHPVHNAQHPKTARVESNSHDWNPPTNLADAGPDGLQITATCNYRKRARNGDDDLIITITYDGQDMTDCEFTVVDYDA
jgi:hypothetical protein